MLRTILLVFALAPLACLAQGYEFPLQTVSLQDLSAFRAAASNWATAGGVSADPFKTGDLQVEKGGGILVNVPNDKTRDNLFTHMEHGDLDLELEVLMPKGSNSGIYLQGRYEIQLLDSWGKRHPTKGDLAGIYERWDDSKPEGQKGYEGMAPRVNVARAPGLWQHLRIEFQAPRFDAAGRKTANARIIRIVLNGVTVHENVELTGPTRGPAYEKEAATGPLLIQGDHGPVAFRNIRYRSYGPAQAALKNLRYRYFSGEFSYHPDFSKLKAVESGDLERITWEVAKGNNDFALQFTGTLQVAATGMYNLTLSSNGYSLLKIDGDTVISPKDWWTRTRSIELKAGEHTFEATYAKSESWLQPAYGVFIEGADFRPLPLHQPSSLAPGNPEPPILLEPGSEPEMLRSFIDIPDGKGGKKRIVHPISVGFPQDISYTFDLDKGALVQVWKGGFLNTAPMWNDRGDGHADPLGSVLLFGDAPAFGVLGAGWADTFPPDANYRFLRYNLDAAGIPDYAYSVFGMTVQDKISPEADGKQFLRELRIEGSRKGVQLQVAKGKNIFQVNDNTWVIDDRRYYIQLPSGAKPLFRDLPGGVREMLLPAEEKMQYHLIW